MRAREARTGDLDLDAGTFRVRPEISKFGRERVVYLHRAVTKQLDRYLRNRRLDVDPDSPLFPTRTGEPFDEDGWANVFTRLKRRSGAVVVIGAASGGERSCATGTAMYVSLASAQLAVALHPGSRTARLVELSRAFSVSILGAWQQDLAAAAGRSTAGPNKFAALGISPVEPPAGTAAPAVADSLAVLWRTVRQAIPTGDQVLYVGEVVAHRAGGVKDEPLLRYRRRYAKSATLSDNAPGP